MSAAKAVSVADIVIVGLGEVGGPFFEEILKLTERGIRIVGVCELSDTPGRRRARELGIPLMDLDQVATLGHAVDIVFDLTGNPAVRRGLREQMIATGNRHTVIAPEAVARILWVAVSEEDALIEGHADRGY